MNNKCLVKISYPAENVYQEYIELKKETEIERLDEIVNNWNSRTKSIRNFLVGDFIQINNQFYRLGVFGWEKWPRNEVFLLEENIRMHLFFDGLTEGNGNIRA